MDDIFYYHIYDNQYADTHIKIIYFVMKGIRYMKKLVALLGAVCLLCTSVPAIPELVQETAVLTVSAAEEAESAYTEGIYGILTYREYADYIEISGCDANAETVEIPAVINGKNVIRIYDNAFMQCSVSTVTLPDTLVTIGRRAFYGCNNLTKIEIPASVTEIGGSAFNNCENLEEVILHEGLEAINSEAFKNTALKSIDIPETVTHFGFEIFDGTLFREELTAKNPLVIFNNIVVDGRACTGDVVIPDTVKEISGYAFQLNTEITSVQIPDSVQEIGMDAFADCTELTSVNIPNHIEEIAIGLFSGCTSLKSIAIPDSVLNIRASAFKSCSSLEEIIFPDHQVDIYSNVFEYTPWLEARRAENPLVIVNGTLIDGKTCTGDVIIPKDVTIISSQAFSWNENITSVVVPAGVHEIWDETFDNCTNLKSAELPGVEYIGSNAFNSCSPLEYLKLSRRLHTIGDNAFDRCKTRGIIYYSGTEEQWNQIEMGKSNLFIKISEFKYGISGDADDDGSLGVTDVIALQKWLHARPDVSINSDLADLDENGIINIFDLCLLKRKLLAK